MAKKAEVFKEGMVAGAKPYEAKMEQLQNAGIEIIGKMAADTSAIQGEVIAIVTEHDNEMHFGLRAAKTFEELGENEKKQFAGLLYSFANAFDSPSENQQTFYKNLLSAWEVTHPQKIDLQRIENIKTIDTQELLYLLFCEYGYLGEENFSFLKARKKDTFKYFSVSEHAKKNIEKHIQDEIKLKGIEGLVEQYKNVSFSPAQNTSALAVPTDKTEAQSVLSALQNAERKEDMYMSNEVAQIFFNKNASGSIATNSYIVFMKDNALFKLHKQKGTCEMLRESIVDVFKNETITSYNDYLLFVENGYLHILDLCEQTESIIEFDAKVSSIKTDGKRLVYIMNTGVFNSDFSIAYFDFSTHKHVSLEMDTEKCGTFLQYFLVYGEYILLISEVVKKGAPKKFKLWKYSFINGQITSLAEMYYDATLLKERVEFYKWGLYADTLFVITSYRNILPSDIVFTKDLHDGFHCYRFTLQDIANGTIEKKEFSISGPFIFQCNQYKNFLIYNNASKGFAIQRHDISTDKKETLAKNYGEDDSYSIKNIPGRFLDGKGIYLKPYTYDICDNWLCLRNKNNEVIPIV